MGQLPRSDALESEARTNVWSDGHDCIPLKQRLKLLLESKHLLVFNDSKPEKSTPEIDYVVKKEEEGCGSQDCAASCVEERSVGRLSMQQSYNGDVGECNKRQGIEAQKCISFNQTASSGVRSTVSAKQVDNNGRCSSQISMAYKCPLEIKIQHCAERAKFDCVNDSSGAGKAKTEIADVFQDDLDHIVLKERQRMLLSRNLLGLEKSIFEDNVSYLSAPVVYGLICGSDGRVKEEHCISDKESPVGGNYFHDIAEGNTSVFGKAVESSSCNVTINASSSRPQLPLECWHQLSESSRSVNRSTRIQNSKRCYSKRTATEHGSCHRQVVLSDNHVIMPNSALSPLVKVKVDPLGDNHLPTQDENAAHNFLFGTAIPVKREHDKLGESDSDKVDHMLLRERMKLLAPREIPHLGIYGAFECSKKNKPSALDSIPIVSESAKPPRMHCPRKRRKTATDSVEMALEEDAPGLLQVLIDKGVLVDEIKLYGKTGGNEDLDESFSEDNFAELEAVMSKLFSSRHSLLKLAPIRCPRSEKAVYCLACLVSLVEQARYLHFCKWPVEWGWCRDLQSFIFVFERHNRIVLERPEYGYATYFFELVDSLSIDWQIKRLVTAMKLSNCSRVTLIENKALMVGEDLTEGEARVLMEYGWRPNSGLATMLNYCDRVVHDRRNEKDSSEWRTKIGKLLMDGYNGGTIVSTEIPKRIMEYGADQSPQLKLEF